MSRMYLILGLVAISFAVVLTLGVTWAAEKEKDVTIKGELVDLWCYLDNGAKGGAHKDCATKCAKEGNPIGLITEKGSKLYLVLCADKKQPKDTLSDKMATTVTLTGRVVKKEGVEAIFYNAMN